MKFGFLKTTNNHLKVRIGEHQSIRMFDLGCRLYPDLFTAFCIGSLPKMMHWFVPERMAQSPN